MFAYCQNNPIMFVDPYGLCRVVGPNLYKVIDCNEIDCKMSSSYVEGDFSEELSVLRGETKEYKGVKVYKILPEDAGFSFGSIFIDANAGDSYADVMLLRHEYGHTRQLDKLGYWGYTMLVVMPSIAGYVMDSANELDVYYYSLPWEYQADIYGNVVRTYPTNIQMGYAYMEYEYFVAYVTGDEEFFSKFIYL